MNCLNIDCHIFRLIAGGVIAAVVAGSFACATGSPRYIEDIDSAQDQVKFLYKEKTDDGDWERGVIECDLAGDEFKECRTVDMEFEAW